jgi:hypothetical protein
MNYDFNYIKNIKNYFLFNNKKIELNNIVCSIKKNGFNQIIKTRTFSKV